MIFRLNPQSQLEAFVSGWNPRELEVERFLISSTEGDKDAPVLSEEIFGEPLLLISNQVKTRYKKRADLLAVDGAGNGVIVELKRDVGSLGVETQALQYLADFSATKGRDFLTRFWKGKGEAEASVAGFLGGNASVDQVNRKTRVILVARSFDSSLFSMGEWLSSVGVAFRCITYTPFEVGTEKFLSFSVAFDRSPEPIYRLAFRAVSRAPASFWHNIGNATDEWWTYLKASGQITAGYSNQPGDEGERLLEGYVQGDKVFAYASGYGALGWGVIEDPKSYRLIKIDEKGQRFTEQHRHRMNINWHAVAPHIEEGIPANFVRDNYGLHHPIRTSISIRPEQAVLLRNGLDEKFLRKA